MESKHVCKKCQRELPDGFKKDICEYCENKSIVKGQNFLKAAATVATTCLGILYLATKNKK